ncbi:MAG: glycosyltransferase family 4 protein [Ignavibacteria bacterium]|jgi:glycosyltransferase involved in cell wall biosynthesis|nr:glycosyltransferase family 4 protein [Ignavibacteria bacterium]MCU7501792.1 glycosyltransferase family 4 protein [Ignavibacteria bacterium]MCU7518287.1 glycosyltransferase family 4 protein [Ignavibacteria bacterium]
MSKKVVILTSGHPPTDERIYHKIGRTLLRNGFSVAIISSVLEADYTENNIHIVGFKGNNLNKKEKIINLKALLLRESPEVIICCEPLTILAARKYKKSQQKKIRIISDITEWYPENVALKQTGLKRIYTYLFLFIFNIYATNLADRLIIGEKHKLRRYRLIAPFKKKTIIGYYPVLEYFHYSPPRFDGKNLVLCFAGVISFERGILNILNAARKVALENPEISVTLRIAGRFQYAPEERLFYEMISGEKKLKIEMASWTKYEDISQNIMSADVCFDLRNYTFVYRNSLPIKLFEYMASGKPVIYSDIKPIRDELDLFSFGFLVNPGDVEEIAARVKEYISNPSLLKEHSQNARRLAENFYNWSRLESRLLEVIRE